MNRCASQNKLPLTFQKLLWGSSAPYHMTPIAGDIVCYRNMSVCWGKKGKHCLIARFSRWLLKNLMMTNSHWWFATEYRE